MEKIPVAAATAPPAASASRGRRVRSSSGLWGVPCVRGRARKRHPVRPFWLRVLLPVFVRTRSGARGVPSYRVGVWGGGDRSSF